MQRKIFISHSSGAKREAIKFKELLHEGAGRPTSGLKLFLSSDWESLKSGQPWFEPLLNELRSCDEVFVLIVNADDFSKLWINFEIGVVLGKENRFPSILVFGRMSWEKLDYPLRGLHLIDTGDSNRWTSAIREALQIKTIDKDVEHKLGCLFRQCSVTTDACLPECAAREQMNA
jgi:hypothetical protein